MAGKQEWELDKQAAEQEHFDKYGFLSDDYGDEDFSFDDSWAVVADQGDSWSWDYPDPLTDNPT